MGEGASKKNGRVNQLLFAAKLKKFFFNSIHYFFKHYSFNAKEIRVGLFEKTKLKKANVFYNIGRFEFYSESESYGIMSNKSDKISFESNNNKVKAYKNGKYLGEKIWFRLDYRSENNSVIISNGKKKRKYKGNIILYSINGKLKIVNEINIDKYVEGVIKGEAGYGYSLEYYKVQSVISRTYALHHQKHKYEGFDLCDHTHCQVYDGINYKKNDYTSCRSNLRRSVSRF